MVGGSTNIPKIIEMVEEFFGKKVNRQIDPDHAVAIGASLFGAVNGGHADEMSSDLVLIDVTSLSLGIETLGGIMTVLIKKNTTIPIQETKKFSTSEDNADNVVIKLFEGEKYLTKDNNFLGKFKIKGIPKAKQGIPQIVVTIAVDSNGIIKVTAEETKMKIKSFLAIEPQKGRLTEEDIKKFQYEAKKL